jgi:hypothetical protein
MESLTRTKKRNKRKGAVSKRWKHRSEAAPCDLQQENGTEFSLFFLVFYDFSGQSSFFHFFLW